MLADETLADGLSILSATLASIIVGAIQDGQFDRYKLGEYFSELEAIQQLERKLQQLENQRIHLRQINEYVRKGETGKLTPDVDCWFYSLPALSITCLLSDPE